MGAGKMTAPRGVTRRDFLKTAAAAAPYVITSSALGGAGQPPASERIALGFIGVGGRGRGIMGGFLRGDAVGLAACDVWRGRRERAAARCGKGAKAYNDYRELLARDDIDAVVIASTEHWHVLHAVAAARAGKDVFCEKPLGLTYVEGRVLAETMKRYGRIFQYGTQQRSSGHFRFACELVRNGRIGRLHTIKVGAPASSGCGNLQPRPVPKELDYDMWSGQARLLPYVGQCNSCYSWGHRSDYSPGWISGWGVHHVDIAQWGNGTDETGPVEIEGTGVFARDGFNDVVLQWNVECTYANGVKMSYTHSGGPNRQGIRFEGTAGWVHVSRGGLSAEPKGLLKSAIGPNEIRLHRSGGHARDFLHAVRTRGRTAAPIEVAHRSTGLCHLAGIACLRGGKLKWDPAAERFTNDEAANKMLSKAMRPPWRV